MPFQEVLQVRRRVSAAVRLRDFLACHLEIVKLMAGGDLVVGSEPSIDLPVGSALCGEGGSPRFSGRHQDLGRTKRSARDRLQPFGRASGFAWTDSSSSGVISAMTVRKGISSVGEKANGSTLPVGTVAALISRSRIGPS